MKVQFRVPEDAGRSVVVVTRDHRTGQESEPVTLLPDSVGEVEIDDNSYLVITAGAATAEQPAPNLAPQVPVVLRAPEPEEVEETVQQENDDGQGGAPETLQVANPTMEETVRATAFDAAKAAGATDEEALAAADALTAPVDPETQESTETADETEVAEETQADDAEVETATEQQQDETVELADATDEQVVEVLRGLETEASVERTKAGYIDTNTANKALEAAGFKPIDAARRNTVSDANGLVKPPEA